MDRVEIRGDIEIEATIFWKAGFQQQIIIHRRGTRKNIDKASTEAEIDALKVLYPSSSIYAVMKAIPRRSWHGIANKAQRLHLRRDKKRRPAQTYRLWITDEYSKLKTEYENCTPVVVIASNLGRSANGVQVRAAKMRLKRNKSLSGQARKDNNPILFQESSLQGARKNS